jgi:hypothetical protein
LVLTKEGLMREKDFQRLVLMNQIAVMRVLQHLLQPIDKEAEDDLKFLESQMKIASQQVPRRPLLGPPGVSAHQSYAARRIRRTRASASTSPRHSNHALLIQSRAFHQLN